MHTESPYTLLLRYATSKWPIAQAVSDMFDSVNLEKVHEHWVGSREYDVLDDVATDQHTVYHQHFYELWKDSKAQALYESFIKGFIADLYDGPFLYQTIPTFRVQQPGNLAVAAPHRDRDYSHSSKEVNYFLPLTDAVGTRTIWVQFSDGEFRPMEVKVGEVCEWDGANTLHKNVLNDSDKSRVSLDFRILRLSDYVPNDEVTVTNQTRMVIGDYWSKHDVSRTAD